MADEMSPEGKSFWLVFGAIAFVVVLGLLFMVFSGSNLRRRWGHGHFSGSRTDEAPALFGRVSRASRGIQTV